MADATGGVSSTMMAPADPGRRVESLDIVRGVALLGILTMNVSTFAMPFAGYSNPTVLFPYEGLNRATFWVVHTLFDLKMMTLFSMLFGAGAAMYAEKAARSVAGRGTLLWLRRMWWLFVIGMLHAYLVWEGDILVAYALCGAIVVWWLRRLPVWALVAVGLVFLAVNTALNVLFFGFWVFINEHPEVAIGSWGMPEDVVASMSDGYEEFGATMAPTDEQLDEMIAVRRGGWLGVAEARAGEAMMIQTFVFATYVFWRATAMMLFGAAMYRLGVFTGERSRGFYLALAAAGYVLGLPLVVGGLLYNESHGFDLGYMSLVGMQFNFFGSIPVAVGHAGLLVWLWKLGALGVLGRALAAVGRMALTNYLMQSVLASLVFYGYGLGLHGSVDRFGQQMVVLAIWGAQLVWSPLWLSRFRFGPAEWAWRSLTYWRRQPMRRA